MHLIDTAGAAAKNASLANYWTVGNELRTNAFALDGPLHIKGANWLGFESVSCKRGGSWSRTRLSDTLDLLRQNGFNALRVPLAVEGCPLSAVAELEEFVRTAGEHGFLVVLNMYTLHPGVLNDNGYVGGEDGYARLEQAWLEQAARFCDPVLYWNVFGADLLSNPHGMYWGPAPDGEHEGAHYYAEERWDTVAARLGGQVLRVCERWLVLVEGVGYCQSKSEKGCEWPSAVGQDRHTTTWWGENLQGVATYPVRFTPVDPEHGNPDEEEQRKLVYVPLVRPPSLMSQDYFLAREFPANLPKVWDRIFGYVTKAPGYGGPLMGGAKPLLVGEWGGLMDNRDKLWQEEFVRYLRSREIAGSFYWSVNPDAEDTYGLLRSWDSNAVVQERVDLLSQLPTTSVPTTAERNIPPPSRPPHAPPPHEPLLSPPPHTPPPPALPPPLSARGVFGSFVDALSDRDPSTRLLSWTALLLLAALAKTGYDYLVQLRRRNGASRVPTRAPTPEDTPPSSRANGSMRPVKLLCKTPTPRKAELKILESLEGAEEGSCVKSCSSAVKSCHSSAVKSSSTSRSSSRTANGSKKVKKKKAAEKAVAEQAAE